MASIIAGVAAEASATEIHLDVDPSQAQSPPQTQAKSPNQNKENDPPPLPTLADRIKARARRTTSLGQTLPPQTTTMTKPQERTQSDPHVPAKRPAETDGLQPLSRRAKVPRGEVVQVPAEVGERQKRTLRTRQPAQNAVVKTSPEKVARSPKKNDQRHAEEVSAKVAGKQNRTPRSRSPVENGAAEASPKKAAKSPQKTDQLNGFFKSFARGGHRQVQAEHQRTSQTVSAAIQDDATLSATRPAAPDDLRPTNDRDGNQDFANQVVNDIQQRLKPTARCFGDRQNEHILQLLKAASPANDEEMLFLSGDEAAQLLMAGKFHNGPILTEGQQPLPLQTISDFLGEYYDDNAKVFIQNPSVRMNSGEHFVQEVTIGSVKKRILESKTKGLPRNCLELATHVEDGLRPRFLAGEDTRLLTKLKLEHTQEYAGRRSYPQGYKEVEKWALLAEPGALTEPHQDSHGYSTYITTNQGLIGFGWLSYPSDKERKTWSESAGDIPGDRFRYVVVKPGQTVYFPAGTVHFVFRLPSAGPTLAFGGHVLRCSNIVHWVKTLLEEQANPQVTNEDLTTSAPGYLDRVEKFVKQAKANGSVDKWGGTEAVAEFLRLKAKFMSISRPKKRPGQGSDGIV